MGTLTASSALLAQTPSVVTIDADKVLIINGRKVFPITMSPGPPTNSETPFGDDALEELADGGAQIIRMAQTTNWNSTVVAAQQASLDWAAQHGMLGMVNLRELSTFAAGDSATEAELRSVMNQFKNHPALAVWKNKDEAWWGNTPVEDLKRGYDVIKEVDPNHPVEQTHAPRGTLQDLQPYNVAADILALDIYPVSIPPGKNSLLANKEISMVGDYTQFLAQVADGQKQIWMVEQIAWSGVTPPANTLVFPTFRQSRYMAYQAIINGARGLMFFGGNVASTLNLQDAPLGWNWTFWHDVLKPVVREIGDHSVLAPALVAADSALPITMSGATAPDIEFRVREAAPYLYILASKREGAAVNVTFSGLPAWAAGGEVLYESPRTVTAQNGQFTDTFAPFDVHVYRFSQTNQSPTIVFPPQGRTNHPGTKATFHVTADGTGPLTYQWKRNGLNLSDGGHISGATTPILTLSTVSQSDAANYEAVVTGLGAATSAPAALAVVPYQPNQVPTVTAHPQSRSNEPGTTATFSVGVSGDGPFAYQWRRNGQHLTDGGHISGATLWNLTLSNVSPADAGSYDVVVSGFGSATSQSATLDLIIQSGSLILYEPFAYPNIGGPVSENTPTNWAFGGVGANDLTVVGENLSYPGLAEPLGNSVSNGGAGLGVRRLFGTTVNSGVLYFSALFRINDIGTVWTGASAQVGALTATDNTSFRLSAVVRAAPSGYNIGVQKGGMGAGPTFDTATNHHAGETVLLVGKYDFTVSPNLVSLWVNPDPATFGSTSEPATGFLSASTGTDGFIIDRFNMRQNTTTTVPAAMQWDELRFGDTWAAVTPPSPPILTSVTLEGGAFQFSYTNNSAQTYSVHMSTDLVDWTMLGLATQTSPGEYQFIDSTTTGIPLRFYQLRSP